MISARLLLIRKSSLTRFLLVLLGTLLMTTAAQSLAAKPPIVIRMLDAPPSFQPERVTIRAGDTVEWKNIGNQIHHATSDPSLAIKKSDVNNPPGAKPFDSGFLRAGESFTQKFSVPGTYRYTCVVHETKGMTAEVVVQK
jgi:plastocyanin